MRFQLGLLIILSQAVLLANAAYGSPEAPKGLPDQARVKPAWKWTTSERLAARFAPGAAIARAASARVSLMEGSIQIHDYVDGATTPELLLPIELYRNFVSIMFDSDLAVSLAPIRTRINSRWDAFRLPLSPEALLRRHAQLVINFHDEDRRRQLEANSASQVTGKPATGIDGDAQALQIGCQLLFESLVAAKEAVRAAGGGNDFLRLLYETVAPEAKVISSNPDQEADLLRAERGCHDQ